MVNIALFTKDPLLMYIHILHDLDMLHTVTNIPASTLFQRSTNFVILINPGSKYQSTSKGETTCITKRIP